MNDNLEEIELAWFQNELCDAIKIAVLTHLYQKDKTGEPYIYHPLTVMMNVKNEDKIFETKCKIVAVLHEVLEHTKDIRNTMGSLDNYIETEFIECIRLLTKKKGYDEDEEEYFKKIKENPIARTVKIADLTYNMDLSRLKEVTVKDKNRYRKYKYWKEYLMDEEK